MQEGLNEVQRLIDEQANLLMNRAEWVSYKRKEENTKVLEYQK